MNVAWRQRASQGRYLRVEGARTNAEGRHPGLFELLRELRESGSLGPDDARLAEGLVTRAYDLHDEPPATAYETEGSRSWFLTDANGATAAGLRLLCVDVVALLTQHGVATRTVTTDDPGMITYADDVQVVAVRLSHGSLGR